MPGKSGSEERGRSAIESFLFHATSRISGIISGFRQRMRERSLEKLLLRSEHFDAWFRKEAERFGINTKNLEEKNYYEILGIKPDANKKAIRDAYIKQIKIHHPDVSKSANSGEMAKEINEAYAALSNADVKKDYARFMARDKEMVNSIASKIIYEELSKKYFALREDDFNTFIANVSRPITRDIFAQNVEDVCNWEWRFERASKALFRNFNSYGKRIKGLYSLNKRLIRREHDEDTSNRLRQNELKLESLSKAYDRISDSITAIEEDMKREIGEREERIARDLRARI